MFVIIIVTVMKTLDRIEPSADTVTCGSTSGSLSDTHDPMPALNQMLLPP